MMKIEKLIEWLRNNNREDNCHDCALGYYLEPEEMLSGIDVAKIACALHELNAYKDLGPIDHLRELAKADREGRCVVLPEGGCEDKDGENALKSAMNTCFYHNNPVTRFIADAVAEKLTRQEAQAALRREQDG